MPSSSAAPGSSRATGPIASKPNTNPAELLSKAQRAIAVGNIEKAFAAVDEEKKAPKWGINSWEAEQTLAKAVDTLDHLRQLQQVNEEARIKQRKPPTNKEFREQAAWWSSKEQMPRNWFRQGVNVAAPRQAAAGRTSGSGASASASAATAAEQRNTSPTHQRPSTPTKAPLSRPATALSRDIVTSPGGTPRARETGMVVSPGGTPHALSRSASPFTGGGIRPSTAAALPQGTLFARTSLTGVLDAGGGAPGAGLPPAPDRARRMSFTGSYSPAQPAGMLPAPAPAAAVAAAAAAAVREAEMADAGIRNDSGSDGSTDDSDSDGSRARRRRAPAISAAAATAVSPLGKGRRVFNLFQQQQLQYQQQQQALQPQMPPPPDGRAVPDPSAGAGGQAAEEEEADSLPSRPLAGTGFSALADESPRSSFKRLTVALNNKAAGGGELGRAGIEAAFMRASAPPCAFDGRDRGEDSDDMPSPNAQHQPLSPTPPAAGRPGANRGTTRLLRGSGGALSATVGAGAGGRPTSAAIHSTSPGPSSRAFGTRLSQQLPLSTSLIPLAGGGGGGGGGGDGPLSSAFSLPPQRFSGSGGLALASSAASVAGGGGAATERRRVVRTSASGALSATIGGPESGAGAAGSISPFSRAMLAPGAAKRQSDTGSGPGGMLLAGAASLPVPHSAWAVNGTAAGGSPLPGRSGSQVAGQLGMSPSVPAAHNGARLGGVPAFLEPAVSIMDDGDDDGLQPDVAVQRGARLTPPTQQQQQQQQQAFDAFPSPFAFGAGAGGSGAGPMCRSSASESAIPGPAAAWGPAPEPAGSSDDTSSSGMPGPSRSRRPSSAGGSAPAGSGAAAVAARRQSYTGGSFLGDGPDPSSEPSSSSVPINSTAGGSSTKYGGSHASSGPRSPAPAHASANAPGTSPHASPLPGRPPRARAPDSHNGSPRGFMPRALADIREEVALSFRRPDGDPCVPDVGGGGSPVHAHTHPATNLGRPHSPAGTAGSLLFGGADASGGAAPAPTCLSAVQLNADEEDEASAGTVLHPHHHHHHHHHQQGPGSGYGPRPAVVEVVFQQLPEALDSPISFPTAASANSPSANAPPAAQPPPLQSPRTRRSALSGPEAISAATAATSPAIAAVAAGQVHRLDTLTLVVPGSGAGSSGGGGSSGGALRPSSLSTVPAPQHSPTGHSSRPPSAGPASIAAARARRMSATALPDDVGLSPLGGTKTSPTGTGSGASTGMGAGARPGSAAGSPVVGRIRRTSGTGGGGLLPSLAVEQGQLTKEALAAAAGSGFGAAAGKGLGVCMGSPLKRGEPVAVSRNTLDI